MPRFYVHVQFHALGIKVTAKNARAAKKKACDLVRTGKRPAKIDHGNTFPNDRPA